MSRCEARDPKGIYKLAHAGKIRNFTGIDSDCEIPEQAEITLESAAHNPGELADQIMQYLKQGEYI